MTPSQAMGTFLRIWRSEWAGMSRAQLAVAVSSAMTNGKRVTPRIIRQWEDGQPPGSTEELDALCKIMRRRAIGQPEVEDFRRTVFDACVDCRYPGLPEGEDFAHRPDVDEVAMRLYSEESLRLSHYERPVGIVAAIAELAPFVVGESPPGVGGGQLRRQQVAYAYLQHGLARHHTAYERYAAAYAIEGHLVDLVEADFGPGGIDALVSGRFLRMGDASSLAFVERAAGRERRGARSLLSISKEALAEGDWFVGVEAFYAALLHPTAFTQEEYRALIARGERLLPLVIHHGPEDWWGPHSGMTLASLRDGDLARGARHFEALCAHADEAPVAQLHVAKCGALLAWHGGHREEALGYLHRTLAINQAESNDPCIGDMGEIEACAAGAEPPQSLSWV